MASLTRTAERSGRFNTTRTTNNTQPKVIYCCRLNIFHPVVTTERTHTVRPRRIRFGLMKLLALETGVPARPGPFLPPQRSEGRRRRGPAIRFPRRRGGRCPAVTLLLRP